MSFYSSTCSGKKHWALFCLSCFPCRLLPGFIICLCEFLIWSCLLCFFSRQNWVQGNSCHQSTELYPLLQIRGLTAYALWMCQVLERNMFDHIFLRSVAVSILCTFLHLIWSSQHSAVLYCGSGLQISPGFIRTRAFKSFHIIFLASRVIPKCRKEKQYLCPPIYSFCSYRPSFFLFSFLNLNSTN